MLSPGLVSITFRQLQPRRIIELASSAGLVGIEWGGDIHVPHGDIQRAGEVHRMMVDSGLTAVSYGSYYRVGCPDQPDFQSILDTALALHAPSIRVWAGGRGSDAANSEYRRRVVDEARSIAHRAQAAGVRVAFEYHPGTLTDNGGSARRLMEEIDHPALGTYWQPNYDLGAESALTSLNEVLPWLTNMHVFYWSPGACVRHPLEDGRALWERFLDATANDGRRHYAMLEFVVDDSEEAFLDDAGTLLSLLSGQETD